MSTTGSILGCVCGLLTLMAFGGQLCAEDEPNPYQLIVDRNAFGLKPPPPPVDPGANKPPAPTTKVTLTGVTSVPSIKALFVYSEQEPGKQPTTKSPILREGEREGPIEVISIDVVGCTVRVKINGAETNLIFEVPKSGPSTAPGAPGGGAPAMAKITPPGGAIPSPLGASTDTGSPTIIGRSSSNDRSGVSVMGATPTAIPAASPAATGITRAGYGGSPGVYASAATALGDGGMSLSLPTRTVRDNSTASGIGTGMTGAQTPPAKALDPVSQVIQMRAAEMRAKQMNIPFPPSPPVPGVDH